MSEDLCLNRDERLGASNVFRDSFIKFALFSCRVRFDPFVPLRYHITLIHSRPGIHILGIGLGDLMIADSHCTCDGKILRIEVVGLLEADGIIELMVECYGRFDFTHAVWDYRRSSMSWLTVESFDKIAGTGATFAEKRGPGAKTVMLVNTDTDLALVRAYAESVSEISTTIFGAFIDDEEAEAFLRA